MLGTVGHLYIDADRHGKSRHQKSAPSPFGESGGARSCARRGGRAAEEGDGRFLGSSLVGQPCAGALRSVSARLRSCRRDSQGSRWRALPAAHGLALSAGVRRRHHSRGNITREWSFEAPHTSELHHIAQSTTELYLLDALRMEELARVTLPFRTPPQVHGTWADPTTLPLQ
ncbi:MAG TPA: carotenoid oxygenase family protein [Steroidobacteraceae bacterium]|nr:carotenoid oxygenase family protein [Steroidobacteraceae bacterium]